MMQFTSFYTEAELQELGFRAIGHSVKISRKVSIYGAERMSIGNNVRIDDFCILSGCITLGSNIHIGAYCGLFGSMGIELEDDTGISSRCTLLSAMDDFSGDYLTGPIHPVECTNVTGGRILMKRYSLVGCGTTIFPNLTLEEGSVAGAMSLINRSLPAWTISIGIPAKVINDRSNNLLKFRP